MAKDRVSSETAAELRVAEALHAAAIHVLRRVRRVDEESGLTAARLSALSVLVRATDRGRAILERGRQRRIAELAGLLETLASAAAITERALGRPPSAGSAYAGDTAERRWSGLSDDSTGSGGTSG